jgi:hypothetical protein
MHARACPLWAKNNLGVPPRSVWTGIGSPIWYQKIFPNFRKILGGPPWGLAPADRVPLRAFGGRSGLQNLNLLPLPVWEIFGSEVFGSTRFFSKTVQLRRLKFGVGVARDPAYIRAKRHVRDQVQGRDMAV